MDSQNSENGNSFKESEFIEKIVTELSRQYVEDSFCTKCPSDQHYFPSDCVSVPKLRGKLIPTDFPSFGFILRTAATDYFLLLRNPMNIIASFLNAVDRMVIITDALLVVEYFPAISKRFFPESFHLRFLEVEKNVELVESDCSSPTSSLISGMNNYWSQTILVLHVSSVLSVCRVAVCLLFVKCLYPDGRNEDMWLILQNKLASWSIVLFPGYKYDLLLPQTFPNSVFSQHKQHLSVILPLQFRESFAPMFHHPELFSTMDACYIPENAKLKLLPPSVTSSTVKALSVEEASQDNSDLISIFGKVMKVSYVMRQWSPSCTICTKTSAEESDNTPLRTSQKVESIINRLKAEPKIPETGIIFPESYTLAPPSEDRVFGTLGCLIKKLVFKDVEGDDEVSVFMRDHFFHSGFEHVNSSCGFLHAGGVLPNTIVCFENLIKKTPQTGKPYFLTTPLTKIVILERPLINVDWSSLGPPLDLQDWLPGRIFWFPLDLAKLVTVKISAKCDCCSNLLIKNKVCPSMCPNSNCKIDATAILKISHFKLPPFNLIMKNSNVQTFLGADDKTWGCFCIAAKKSPLLYHSTVNVVMSCKDPFSVLFHYYCEHFRPKVRYHVCVKIMRQREDYDCRAVFCLVLSDVDLDRTAKLAFKEE